MEVVAEALYSPWTLCADHRNGHYIFINDTMVNVGGIPRLIYVAFEPDQRTMPGLPSQPARELH